MKQKLILDSYPFNKNAKKTKIKMQDMMKYFLIPKDYEIFVHLLAHSEYESENWNLEPFLHRFGKEMDIRLEEKKEQHEDKISEVQTV